MGLGLSLGLGLWPTEADTLGDVGMDMILKLGVHDAAKSIEPVAVTLWDLEFDLLGLYRGLDSPGDMIAPGLCTDGLGVVSLHLLQALPVVLGKVHVPQELGIHTLNNFVSL